MPHHTVAWFESINNVTNEPVAAVVDDIIPITNSNFIPYRDYDLIALQCGSATATRARLNSGTIRQVNPSYIRPINLSLLPGTNPNVMMMFDNPFRIKAHEELALEASGAAGGAENFHGVGWFSTGLRPAPQGRIYRMRWTHATTVTANAWSTCTLTFETGLPAGKYAVVGSDYFGTTGIAHRWIFDGQVERPGTMSYATAGLRHPYHLEQNLISTWGEFFTYSLPRLQAFCNAADTSGEGYMNVVQVASFPAGGP